MLVLKNVRQFIAYGLCGLLGWPFLLVSTTKHAYRGTYGHQNWTTDEIVVKSTCPDPPKSLIGFISPLN